MFYKNALVRDEMHSTGRDLAREPKLFKQGFWTRQDLLPVEFHPDRVVSPSDRAKSSRAFYFASVSRVRTICILVELFTEFLNSAMN